MTNAIGRTVIVNTDNTYTVQFTIIGDSSGDETATRVNAVSGDMGTDNKIEIVESTLVGFSARLLFDGTTDVFAHQLAASTNNYQDYRKEGGLINTAGAGRTGDVLITTTGLTTGSGHITLHIRKRGNR